MHPNLRRLAVAPMLGWTDRHFRYFARLLSRRTLLYTEMVTTGALLHGAPERLLRFDPAEHPVALQLAGAEPRALARGARLGADWGYDEINFNVGCPSPRVQNARFGACLMAEPALVAECVAAMKAAVAVPVTVKTRLGIDGHEDYEDLAAFTAGLVAAGCDALIVHARIARLRGLDPRGNRTRPPLRYEIAVQLKRDFPTLPMVLNGGIVDLTAAAHWLERFEGVMIGRAAYRQPWLLTAVDHDLFGDSSSLLTPHAVLEALRPYVARELAAGVPLKAIARHLLGLFQGQPGARAWRHALGTRMLRPDADWSAIAAALAQMPTPP